MQNLTPQGQQLINDLSQRYNLSYDAVLHMLIAVNNGGSSMAQFSCPELGGSGQWMRGGMTMVGDMFNNGLKMTVDNLCNDLANGLSNMQVFAPLPKGSRNSNQWWPQDLGLGQPFSSGAQNNIRYAIFPNRLAVEVNGKVTVYNTLDNNIGGVSQQQGGNDSLTFSSQYGTIAVSSLPIVTGSGNTSAPIPPPQNNFLDTNTPPSYALQNNNSMPQGNAQSVNTPNLGADTSVDNIIGLIEKLAKLRDAGAISENDYNNKKAELLNRI
ncbi:SHOCT domain-containing protein [Marinomonas sp. 15G1-11]|uniref:SHOCT domain-containing protein n=1 Tax=Marinomonas phaeophyticola TaxID=3004091 RepID=A0ABT4JVI2_9GAMM|nr:SHOCT domain-containing protein [Marinomonas sp. 15G1-11]MCZ2721788.1 SHOCT domain-containing protein [Marinomonas sp. 15G1-11]